MAEKVIAIKVSPLWCDHVGSVHANNLLLGVTINMFNRGVSGFDDTFIIYCNNCVDSGISDCALNSFTLECA